MVFYKLTKVNIFSALKGVLLSPKLARVLEFGPKISFKFFLESTVRFVLKFYQAMRCTKKSKNSKCEYLEKNPVRPKISHFYPNVGPKACTICFQN